MAAKCTLYTLQYKCVQFTLSKKIFWQIFFNKSFWAAVLKKLRQWQAFFLENMIISRLFGLQSSINSHLPTLFAPMDVAIGWHCQRLQLVKWRAWLK